MFRFSKKMEYFLKICSNESATYTQSLIEHICHFTYLDSIE